MTGAYRAVLMLALVAAPARLRAQCPDGTPQPCERAAPGAPRGVAVLEFLNESSILIISDSGGETVDVSGTNPSVLKSG